MEAFRAGTSNSCCTLINISHGYFHIPENLQLLREDYMLYFIVDRGGLYGGRGRGSGRGGARGRGRAGRGYSHSFASVDRRTTKINAIGFEREDKDEVLAHFAVS